ncbi:hypothetical protein B1A_08625 [mine drainage metagenome]|uniref:Peroxiredoxin n=1 Tax=mine drainage metagenome TaxID=410659 RepID=T1AWR3_9ZZZZ
MQFRKKEAPKATLSSEAGEMADAVLETMKKKKLPSWLDTLKQISEVGEVNVYGCAMFADLMGIKKEDLDPIVKEVIGVSQFMDMAKNSKMTLFL